MNYVLSYGLQSLEHLQDLAVKIAGIITSNLDKHNAVVIKLKGGIGAGKTSFTSFCLSAIDSNIETSSPTYPIINYYTDKIFHIDMYRIESVKELGFVEFPRSGIIFVEWPKFENSLPFMHSSNFIVELKFTGDSIDIYSNTNIKIV